MDATIDRVSEAKMACETFLAQSFASMEESAVVFAGVLKAAGAALVPTMLSVSSVKAHGAALEFMSKSSEEMGFGRSPICTFVPMGPLPANT